MINAIINIGMATNDGETISAHEVNAALRHNGIISNPLSAHFHVSDSEPTFVGHVVFTNDADVYDLAVQLKQDCIAIWDSSEGAGRLIGPNTEAWGAFNPRFFILPSGKRLSEVEEQSA